MRQPAGPRVPIMSGNGAGVWIAVLAGWGLAAVTWLAWLAARIAAALAGGHVPSFGEHWVYTVLRGRTAQAWPGTPTVLVIAAGLILACAAAAAVAVAWRFIGRRIPRPEDPVAALSRNPQIAELASVRRGQERHPAAPVAGRGQPPQAVSRRYRAAARRSAQAVRPRPGPVRVLGRHHDRGHGAPLGEDHHAGHPAHPVRARPGRRDQRPRGPVGRDQRAARRDRDGVGVRPAAGDRLAAAVVGGPAGRAADQGGRYPAGRPLRLDGGRRAQARHLGAGR